MGRQRAVLWIAGTWFEFLVHNWSFVASCMTPSKGYVYWGAEAYAFNIWKSIA